MDVTASCFNRVLPRILNDIAESRFVALDLEFSGIAGRENTTTTTTTFPDAARNRTLQNRYSEIKDAAEKFTVLQLGLTFIKHDTETGQFVLRPYNLHLNPILDSRLDIEREWACQSSSMEFLIRNGFRIDESFRNGVRYLSRDEEAGALALQAEKEAKRDTLQDIKEEELSPADKAFVAEARRMIDEWLDTQQQQQGHEQEEIDAYLNIPPPRVSKHKKHIMPDILNGYQKRLVHQTVRTYYPSHVSRGKDTFVQIIPLDREREQLVKEDRRQHTRQRVIDHIGFRWIIEALVGGDLSSLTFVDDCRTENGDEALTQEELLALNNTIVSKLAGKQRPVLVGHNVFVDLVYLYRCFIGELPPRLKDFQRELHALFPKVIDTKFLATRTQAHANAQNSSLRELIKSLEDISDDCITIDMEHVKYNLNKIQHEAGYDSLVTAQAFLKLVTELYAEVEVEKMSEEEGNNERTEMVTDIENPSLSNTIEQQPMHSPTQTWNSTTVHHKDVLEAASCTLENANGDSNHATVSVKGSSQLRSGDGDDLMESDAGLTTNNYDSEGEEEILEKANDHLIDFDSDNNTLGGRRPQTRETNEIAAAENDLIDFDSPSPIARVRRTSAYPQKVHEDIPEPELLQSVSSSAVEAANSRIHSLNQHPPGSHLSTNTATRSASLALNNALILHEHETEIETPASQSRSSSSSSSSTTRNQIRKPVWENNDGLGWGSTAASATTNAIASASMREWGDTVRPSSSWNSITARQGHPSAWDVEERDKKGEDTAQLANWDAADDAVAGQHWSESSWYDYNSPGPSFCHELRPMTEEMPFNGADGENDEQPASDDSEGLTSGSGDEDDDLKVSGWSPSCKTDIFVPGSEHPLWAMCMNKLRVYGTEEEICDLADFSQEEFDNDSEGLTSGSDDDDDEEREEAEDDYDEPSHGEIHVERRTSENRSFGFEKNLSTIAPFPTILMNRMTVATRPAATIDPFKDDLWLER